MRMLLFTWKTKCFSPEKFLQRNSQTGTGAALQSGALTVLQRGENLAAVWSPLAPGGVTVGTSRVSSRSAVYFL
ncbi:unnamed protein product, partial [Bubo scandiacus]